MLVVIVLISMVLFAVTIFRSHRRAWDWWLSIAIVLACVGLYLPAVTRPWAGISAFIAQLVLIAGPLRAQRLTRRASRLGNTKSALWFARLAALLHPSRAMRSELQSLPALLALREGVIPSEPVLQQLAQGNENLRKVLDYMVLNGQGRVDDLWAILQDYQSRQRFIAAGGGTLTLRLAAMMDGDPERTRSVLAEIETLDPTLKETDRQALLAAVAIACFSTPTESLQVSGALSAYLAPGEPAILSAFCAWRTGDSALAQQLLDQAARENADNPAAMHGIKLMREVTLRARPVSTALYATDLSSTLAGLRSNVRSLAAIAPLEGRSVGTPWLTFGTTVVLIGVHLWLISRGSPVDPEHLYRSGAVVTLDFTLSHDWWRLITYGLLHAGLLHLAFNLGALWSFGRFCEAFYGTIRTSVVYLIAGVLGGWAVVHWADPLQPTVLVGASGSIFALGGAMLAALGADKELRNTARGRRELSLLVVLFVTQYAVDRNVPGISSTAHIVGLATGVLLGALLTLLKRFTSPRSSSFALEPKRP